MNFFIPSLVEFLPQLLKESREPQLRPLKKDSLILDLLCMLLFSNVVVAVFSYWKSLRSKTLMKAAKNVTSLKNSHHVHKMAQKNNRDPPLYWLTKKTHLLRFRQSYCVQATTNTSWDHFYQSFTTSFSGAGDPNIGISQTFGEIKSYRSDYGLESVEQVSVKATVYSILFVKFQ